LGPNSKAREREERGGKGKTGEGKGGEENGKGEP